ncbi:MAG: cobalt ECF transporter T component CbiQ [Peptococcaceae bacterium]|nr:cobalt ECF transporter T component CbiQ [Peptococcaceae bacterium]
MSNIMSALSDLRLLDNLARGKTFIHRINPLVKLLTTVVYLTVVVSFGRYEISSLLTFIFYPVLIFALAELPVTPILKKVLFVQPLIIGIGILNPIFDSHSVLLGDIAVSRGWITFLAIFIKSGLTVTVSILLIATTGMDRLAAALRMLKIPKIFVLQLILTYRYISVLMEEVHRMLRAYSLRAPGQKGVQRNHWGSFAGQLLLRTFDRAQRVYQSMSLRGFNGEYHTGKSAKLGLIDFAYFSGWSIFFILARIYDIPVLMGSLLIGVMK